MMHELVFERLRKKTCFLRHCWIMEDEGMEQMMLGKRKECFLKVG